MFDTAEPITAAGDPVVLVVDDTDAVREVVSLGLRHQGFEVRAADNGRDAIELYHELRQQDRNVTVLLDIQMPGLDGPLVLAALQALEPGVRAYFMTGDAGQYCEGDLLAMGGRGVFPKPFPIAAAAAEFRRAASADGPPTPAFSQAVADRDGPGAEFAPMQPGVPQRGRV
jgi:two-component system OmpR family response regulator